MRLRELLPDLVDDARARDALGDDGIDRGAWFVRALVALGTWVGAAMVGLFLALFEAFRHSGPRLSIAAVMLVVAVVADRARRGDFVQLVFIGSISVQVLLMFEVSRRVSGTAGEELFFVAMQLALLVIIASPLHRFLSTVALVGGLMAVSVDHGVTGMPDVVVLGALLAGTALLVGDVRWSARLGNRWRPVAFGLLTSGISALLVVTGMALERHVARPGSTLAAPGLLGAGLMMLLGVVMAVAHRELGRSGRAPSLWLGVVAMLLAWALTHRVPGIPAAFLLLALAHLRREKVLVVLGLACLGLSLAAFYYALHTPLLQKSLWVVASGVLVLVVRALVNLLTPATVTTEQTSTAPRWHAVALAGAVALVLAVLGGLVAQKERVLQDGRVVLLPLAPRDPRSLMQGDDMVLRYRVPVPDDAPRDGRLVLRLDGRSVGELVRVHDERTPTSGTEQLLRYRRRRGETRIGAESFFFAEGQSARYERARYAELRVTDDGESVLVGLRDEALQPL